MLKSKRDREVQIEEDNPFRGRVEEIIEESIEVGRWLARFRESWQHNSWTKNLINGD